MSGSHRRIVSSSHWWVVRCAVHGVPSIEGSLAADRFLPRDAWQSLLPIWMALSSIARQSEHL
jgi:hypothetical protein